MEKCLFYKLTRISSADSEIDPAVPAAGLRIVLWKPSLLRIKPAGAKLYPFALWWLMHLLRMFSNRNYCALLLYDSTRLIHRSIVLPRYFRFPFMCRNDLQIGYTWTDSVFRGKGLATAALREAVKLCGAGTYWYVVPETNHASIRVVEKAGFSRVGTGYRFAKWGSLAAYRMQPIAESGETI